MGWQVSIRQNSTAIPVDIAVPAFDILLSRIRLYSTKTLKPLGTLNYHKDGCQIVVFARSLPYTASPADVGKSVLSEDEESDDEEEMNERERKARTRWLASGGKDHRVSIWSLMSFDNSGT
jgi:ASTRA-associated protein 1